MLSGSQSPSRFHKTVEAIDDALPDSRIATFEGQEHLAHYTAPDQFNEEVLAFIRKTD